MRKKIKIFTCFLMLVMFQMNSQNITKHKVLKGESIKSIAEKYKVTLDEIYSLNPEVLNGLDEDVILLIPSKSEVIKPKNDIIDYKIHIVKEGETLYSLAKMYNTTVESLEKENPELKNSFNIDQKIRIPKTTNELNKPTTIVNSDNKDTHIVQPKETLFGIAKKYNLTQKELLDLNPDISENLPVGYILKLKSTPKTLINKNNETDNKNVSIKDTKHTVLKGETLYSIARKYNLTSKDILDKNPNITENISPDAILIIPSKNDNTLKNSTEQNTLNKKNHKVEKGETLFSISKKYNLTLEELMNLNPEVNENLQEGTELSIEKSTQTSKIISTSQSVDSEKAEVKKEVISTIKNEKVFKVLNNSLKNNLKEISILIPFNIANQDFKSTEYQNKLKKDAFLNLSLDFYSGALIAIDSLKKLNINTKINFLDSNETKSTNNINLLKDKIQTSNVIIGPFYQKNAEEVAKTFSNIPVISPLSKDNHSPIKNLYQSTPSSEYIKIQTFNYLNNKNENIIALIDKNKNLTRSIIKNSFKKINLAPINEKGNFITDSIIIKLCKDKLNYLIIETSNLSSILQTLVIIDNIKSKGFNMQAVILDMNKNYESDDVFPKLLKLNFIYPSISKPNEDNSGKRFNKIYKQRYHNNPSIYATRGFDIVLDTALRISQEESFESIANNSITSHLEYKFDYQKNPFGEGYINNGIYFLKYSKDMKIVEVED